MASRLDAWKRLHAAGERELSRSLAKFFKAQNARILDAMPGSPSPADIAKAIDAAAERDAMIEAIGDKLIGFMATGAARVLKQSPKPRKRKDADDVLQDFTLPDQIERGLLQAFKDLTGKPYWLDIQKNYEASLTDFLTEKISEGISGPALAKQLRSAMEGMSKVRAEQVARTETTACYGAGHNESYLALHEDGLIEGVEWLTVGDDDVRPDHEVLHGTIIKPGETFSVGGEEAEYPASADLSPGQRISCRCTTVGVFTGE